MKSLKLAKSFILSFVLLVAIGSVISSCSDDIENPIGDNQGEVSFVFEKITTYINEINDIESIKITLLNGEEEIVLPSLSMTGTKETIATPSYILNGGTYKIKSYIVYDKNANLMFEADLVENNEFNVQVGGKVSFRMPIMIKDIIVGSNTQNILLGICIETFGPDTLDWKVSWRANKEISEWDNLEFDHDEYNNIVGICGLTLDDKFKDMTTLNPSIVNISSIRSLTIKNNNLESLPENFGKSNIQHLVIENTNISSFPESTSMSELTDVVLKGNKFTEFPEILTEVENLSLLNIIDEDISSIPESLGKLGKLRSLIISGTNITSLPNVFDRLYKVSTLNFNDNKNLVSLPATIEPVRYDNGQLSYLRAIYLDGCGFASIPKEVVSPKFNLLSFRNNKITEIKKSDIESLPAIHTLVLDGNALSSFPAINSKSLGMLSLINTGLTRSDVDITGMPLFVKKPNWIFFTQEEYDAVMAATIPAK